ncbi:hypothetical protein D3C71_953680 [compost metagenome]
MPSQPSPATGWHQSEVGVSEGRLRSGCGQSLPQAQRLLTAAMRSLRSVVTRLSPSRPTEPTMSTQAALRMHPRCSRAATPGRIRMRQALSIEHEPTCLCKTRDDSGLVPAFHVAPRNLVVSRLSWPKHPRFAKRVCRSTRPCRVATHSTRWLLSMCRSAAARPLDAECQILCSGR